MLAISPLFARVFSPFGLLFALTVGAGANDLPRFVGRPAQPARVRLAASRRAAVYNPDSMPVYFEKEPDRARFQARTQNSALLFDRGGFWMGFGPAGSSVRVKFHGARGGIDPTGQSALPAFSNYFLGSDPSRWSRRQHYAGVRYDALWPGVDLVFYAQNRNLEYDFNVAPYANAGKIRLQVNGAQKIFLDEHGELWIANQYGKAKQRHPLIYQDINGRRVAVDGGYRMKGRNQVGFWLGAYDRSRGLVIDPVLEFATYIGGNGFDLATAVAVDSSNNIYVTGYTQFADFKSTPAGLRLSPNLLVGANVFLVKLDANTKQIVYIDYFGGTVYDAPWSLAVDSSGAVTIVGETLSPDMPTVNALLTHPALFAYGPYGFAARFVPDGSRLSYSTYTATGAAYGIGLNSSGAAWVVGGTTCYVESDPELHEFQPTGGAQQATCAAAFDQETGYLMQIDPNGAKLYASYYVPPSEAGYVSGLSDATVDTAGNVYVAGTIAGQYQITRALPQPDGTYANGPSPNLVCEVTKFDQYGHTVWLTPTTLSGSRDQECLRIAADPNANVYVAGYTTSQNFQVTGGAFQKVIGSPGEIPNVDDSPLGDVNNRPLYDSFVARIDTTGKVVYSSYLGGNGDDYAIGIGVNGSGNAYVTGYTNSRNFPVTPGAPQTTYGGGQGDAYVTGVSTDGTQLIMSTFFGGTGQDEGYQVAVDRLGNVYLAGGTESADLPVTSDAFQRTNQNADGMVAKFNLETCNPTVVLADPLLSAGSGSTTLTLTTDVPGCSWTLGTTATWIQFNPASGSGNQTINLSVTANPSTDSRLAIVAANSRRTFVYQSGQSVCHYILLPGDMALSSNSEQHQVTIQAPNQSCTWTATSSQSWLHILSPASGMGTGTISIGTDQNNTTAVRTATLSIGGQTIVVGQSAGGCVITLSSGALEFSPAGGLGAVKVVASSNQCSWQAQTPNPDWIGLVAITDYGSGTVRFNVLPNSTGQPRTGTISVGSQSGTITQASVYTNLRDQAGNYTSSPQSSAIAHASHGRRTLAIGERPAAELGNCGSTKPQVPIEMDAAGDPVQFTVNRTLAGCGMNASFAISTSGFTITPASVQANSGQNITFTVAAQNNTSTSVIKNAIILVTGDTSAGTWQLEVDQAGTAAAPLDVPSSQTLQPVASSDAIPINSTNGTPCNWAVDPSSVPTWISPVSISGSCGSQLQFSYGANTTSSQRKATLRFTTGDETELNQLASATTSCVYSFQQTTPQDVALNGGQLTLNVVTASGCTWTASTDSPGWISFPSGSGGTSSGQLVLQAAANDTTSKRTAQISVDVATAYVTEDPAASFPTGCVYTLSPTSNSFPNTGGSFTFQVQTTANCTWQASQPAADASFVHLQSTASVTGLGMVSFTVDANPTGSGARSSSITVAPGVSFAIMEAAGPTPGCTYALSPSSASFTSAGGSSSFQVQTASGCSWQTSQPSTDTWVHIKTGSNGNGPGEVSFAVDANSTGTARSSSIGVATTTFAISQAAG